MPPAVQARGSSATPDLRRLVERVLVCRRGVTAKQSVLVALTGIDGAGKGYIAGHLARALEFRGLRVATINIDGWLNLPHRRFSDRDPAGHFYQHAIRFDDLFTALVLPLKRRRSVRLTADFAEETATAYRPQTWQFDDVDVILLEGIYLLKQELRHHYDLSCWIVCGFATALRRAMLRAQEGLPPAETVRAYRTIYFPAQRMHFVRDAPRAHATLTLHNG